jgi:hypothetical protein
MAVTTRKFLFMSAEGFQEEQDAASGLSLAQLALTGDAGLAMTVNGCDITGLPAIPSGSTAAASKAYVDSVAVGLQPKDVVEATATVDVPALTGLATVVDTFTLSADGMRVLLTAQATATENGIWVVHSGVWTRPTDFAIGSDEHGAFVLAINGHDWKGAGFVCTNPAGGGIVGADALTFVQFSAVSQLTASNGAVIVGQDIQVKPGDGIEVSSNSGSTNVALAGTNPGLQLTGSAGSKVLSFKPYNMMGLANGANGAYIELPAVDPTLMFDGSGNLEAKLSSVGGLKTSAAGMSVKIDPTDTNLSLSASGLTAMHSPDTAPMLYTIAGLAAGDAVYYSASDSVSVGSSSADSTSRIIGIAMATVAPTTTGRIVASGKVAGVLTGATANTPYYLGTTGQPVLAAGVGNGKRNVCLGYAINATDLWVEIKDYGKKAS